VAYKLLNPGVCFEFPSVLCRCWLGDRKGIRPVKTEWWDAGLVVWDEMQMGKGDRLPVRLVCNRQQRGREGPGARKITSIALRRS